MNAMLRQPMLHFALLGALAFAGLSWFGSEAGTAGGPSREIVLSADDVASLASAFARAWQRLPSEAELDGLVAERVREEVYVREALALGLDRNDEIVRRRLRQKMEFLTDDVAALPEPSDEELLAWLEAHPERFLVEARLSFRHAYLSPDRHGDDLERDAAAALAKLRAGGDAADAANAGDSFLLGYAFDWVAASEVAQQFGEAFAAELARIPTGTWQGPVASGYGVHLVFVSARSEGRRPDLAEARDSVLRDWEVAKRREANDATYRELLDRYEVKVTR